MYLIKCGKANTRGPDSHSYAFSNFIWKAIDGENGFTRSCNTSSYIAIEHIVEHEILLEILLNRKQ